MKRFHYYARERIGIFMPIVTLLEKIYGPNSINLVEPLLQSLCEGLKARLRVIGKTARGWIQVDVHGEDQDVVIRLLDQKMKLAPISLAKVKKFSLLKGKLAPIGAGEDNLRVDIGVSHPKLIDATISFRTLQAQVVDGRRFSLERIIDLFCFHANIPLEVKVTNHASIESESLQAMLSEGQLSEFTRWIHSYLDRLIVLGAPLLKVEAAIRRSGHARDTIRIESLGLLEHAILCKLGTEAKGLMPKLGPMLPYALLAPFGPRRIKQLIKRPAQ